MEARHEIIPFDHDSPVRLFMHKLGDVSRHWHESLELLFVLAGEVTVLTGGTQSTLRQDDMLLINSNVVHELHSADCVMIAVQVKLSKFQLPPDVLESLYFDCNSEDAPSPERFRSVKRLIAAMLQTSRGGENALLRSRSLAYELLSELVQKFKVEKPVTELNTHKHLARLNSILQYIGAHYQEQLTLGHLAEREHLSAPYLSSFFEKYMGVNFSTYYTNLRLEHAVRTLLYTDMPVEQVAVSSGFSDPRAFVRAFKKRYQTVPSAYRKTAAAPAVLAQKDPLLSINYLDFKPENYFHILTQYLPQPGTEAGPTLPEEGRVLAVGTVDCGGEGRLLAHKWRAFIGVGRAKELLYAPVQDMLRQLQRDVGFRYLRFHGIFSDDMLVCRASREGVLQFSFAHIDKALDFILSIGLKPLIQFSFMPAALAADPDKTIFASPFVISPPRRMEDWTALIGSFLNHVRKRYGTREIRSWLYSVWNEPDTSVQMFGFEDGEQFLALYEATCRAVRSFDPELTFGSPSLYPTTAREVSWMKDFLSFARRRDCMPRFLDVHYYSDDFQQSAQMDDAFCTHAFLSEDPDHFAAFLTEMEGLMAGEGVAELPLYITEWNLTVSHRNLINDTCFKAAYVAKNFLENYDRADAIGYWGLTDFLEEYQLPQQPFHGGMGLFSQEGIKKPPYFALQMLARLGDRLIGCGEGWFLTRRGGALALMLYNYEHFSPLFSEGGLGLTLTSRDGVFPRLRKLEVTAALTGLPEGMCRVRETVLNQSWGSAFDRWVEMGAPELGAVELDWLKQATHPELRVALAPAPQGRLEYRALLAPHEVRLVEIFPEDGE